MSGRPQALRVDITPTALAGIEARARARLTRFGTAERASGLAGKGDLLRRNILGVAGEQGVLLWLRTLKGDVVRVHDATDAYDGPSDLAVTTGAGVLGLEVKTTTYDGWLRHGRSIAEDQLYETDAEIYIWCAGPRASKPQEVHIIGWSTSADVRRACSEQRYTGFQDGFARPAPISASSHADNLAPKYGLDDPGFDEYEWEQSPGLRGGEAPVAIEDWDMREPVRRREALAVLLTPPEWREGNEPRPGFGQGKPVVRVDAAVRPLDALVDWIRQWKPEC